MKKRMLISVTLFATPIMATEPNPLAKAVFGNMAVSYICRYAIGDSSYMAAMAGAKVALAPVFGEKTAILYVDEMDRKFKADPRGKNPKLDAATCYRMKAEAMHEIDLATARSAK